MAEAYKCDNCKEYFEGTPPHKLEGQFDICDSCWNTLKLFAHVDPFDLPDQHVKEE